MWRVWLVPRMQRTGLDDLVMGLEIMVPVMIVWGLVMWWVLRKQSRR